MQFKHLAAKTKRSLFLILLVVIGIGVFVLINNGDSKISNKEKHVSEDNTPEKVNGTTNGFKPDLVTGNIGERNNNQENIVEFGYDQIGMKFIFPDGWVQGEKFGKDHLLTIISPVKTIIDIRAIKTETNAKDFAEDIHKNPGYNSVVGGDEGIWKEFVSSEIITVTIIDPKSSDSSNVSKYYSVDTYSQNYGCRAFYIIEKNGYLISFMSIYDKNNADKVRQDIKTILKNIRWGNFTTD